MTNVAKARLLVSALFTLLGAIGLVALAHVDSKIHNYLIEEALTIAAGFIVLIFAWHALRPSLQISPIPKEGAIFISRGIYQYVRHPMYLGVILVGFGIAGFADSLVSWIFEFLLIIVLNFKATFEDGLVRETYPEAWHYQSHTAKVFPCMSGACKTH